MDPLLPYSLKKTWILISSGYHKPMAFHAVMPIFLHGKRSPCNWPSLFNFIANTVDYINLCDYFNITAL